MASAPNSANPIALALEDAAPEADRALRNLDGALWLEPPLWALVQVRAAQLSGPIDRLAGHVREAIELGETHHRLIHLASWRESLLFTDRERAALALTEALTTATNRDAIVVARALAAGHPDPSGGRE